MTLAQYDSAVGLLGGGTSPMISLAQKELDKAVTTMLHLGKHGAFRKNVSLGVFGLEGGLFFHTENINQSGALKPFFEGKHTTTPRNFLESCVALVGLTFFWGVHLDLFNVIFYFLPMVDHHLSPFGRICLERFPSIMAKQIKVNNWQLT